MHPYPTLGGIITASSEAANVVMNLVNIDDGEIYSAAEIAEEKEATTNTTAITSDCFELPPPTPCVEE